MPSKKTLTMSGISAGKTGEAVETWPPLFFAKITRHITERNL